MSETMGYILLTALLIAGLHTWGKIKCARIKAKVERQRGYLTFHQL